MKIESHLYYKFCARLIFNSLVVIFVFLAPTIVERMCIEFAPLLRRNVSTETSTRVRSRAISRMCKVAHVQYDEVHGTVRQDN